jgi:hypothetical protein
MKNVKLIEISINEYKNLTNKGFQKFKNQEL